VQGGAPGVGNLDQDPMFVDAANGDLHLSPLSPCINQGDNSTVVASMDSDHSPRIQGGTVDMGADEFGPTLYITGDNSHGGSVTLNILGMPNSGPTALFLSPTRAPAPVETPWGQFQLGTPLQMLGNLGALPANGILQVSGTLPNNGGPSYELHLQALMGSSAWSNMCTLQVH
jgi:hypothetical protein